jgi:hypothetical protein
VAPNCPPLISLFGGQSGSNATRGCILIPHEPGRSCVSGFVSKPEASVHRKSSSVRYMKQERVDLLWRNQLEHERASGILSNHKTEKRMVVIRSCQSVVNRVNSNVGPSLVDRLSTVHGQRCDRFGLVTSWFQTLCSFPAVERTGKSFERTTLSRHSESVRVCTRASCWRQRSRFR